MRVNIKVSKKDLVMLQELENASGLDKNSIVSNLIDEVYTSYKCSKISKSIDYMPMALETKKLLEDIKK